MKLRDLLKGLNCSLYAVDGDAEISVPVSDSRNAEKNSLFLCISGTKRDGADFAENAVKGGSVACVAEKGQREKMPSIPCVTVENVRHAAAVIWNNYYGNPAENMRLFGITGTCGKTSTARFLKSILEADGRKTGLLGTEGFFVGDEKMSLPTSEVSDAAAAMTTPDPKYLYGALFQMKCAGVTDVVMEVSSHSVYQAKVDALDFFCGIFTNLSPEHLDLHGDMESYFAVKKSFLDKCKILVYNRDDAYGKRFYPLSYSFGKSDAEIICKTVEKTEYLYKFGGEKIHIETPAAGGFTLYNTMAAACSALACGCSRKSVENGVFNVRSITGRMEKIVSKEKYGFTVFVDYAHTPAALETVLKDLKKTNAEKLTVLFGCGGDRDTSKRSTMGQIACTYADRVIVTSDNSRTEDRMKIIEDILKGVTDNGKTCVIPDRRHAVCYAAESAIPGEIILLAGKGHEEYEIVGDRKRPFSERAIVAEVLKRKFGK